MASGLTKVFLLSCDNRIEKEVSSLISSLQLESGKLVIKTMHSVPEAKGSDFGKKLENVLNWGNAVLIICSENLSAFLDAKDTKHCPPIISSNAKKSVKVLNKFLEKQMKEASNKVVVLSLTGDKTLPSALKGMRIIENAGNEDAFVKQVVAELQGK